MNFPPKRNDKYNTYDDVDFKYYEPTNFRKANFDYLTSDNRLYAQGNYGDTYNLGFDLTKFKDYEEAKGAPKSGSAIRITFYNFRHESVYSVDKELNDGVSVIIDKDLSEDTFKRGNYFCEVKLILYINSTSSVSTLIPQELCLLNVR